MNSFKRLGALVLIIILCMSVLAGCAEEEVEEALTFSVCVGDAPVSLDPIYAEEVADQTVLTHLYENLMRVSVDENGEAAVVNGMAKSVDHEENHDGTVTFTFRLRTAEWTDGMDVTAADFVYAWRRLADPLSQSPYAELLSVVAGYEEARAFRDMSLLQVTAKNDTTLVVNLTGHYDWFLREVCTSPATMPLRQDVVQQLKEAAAAKGTAEAWWSDPTALVTNGAYWATSYTEEAMELVLGSHYYESRRTGPQKITFRFAGSDAEAWKLYEEGQTDVVWPASGAYIAALASEEGWMAVPELGVHTALFNCAHPLFADVRIRQAMSMVIDRNALAELNGVTAAAAEGLVPCGVPDNEEEDFRTAGGALLDNDPELYAQRCAEAKVLLEDAGYNNGGELGELEFLYVEEGAGGAVAQLLCEQWRQHLGVQVTAKSVTESELWTALRSGEYALAGVELDAVGNDAECFLMKWVSGSVDNVIAYQNTAYDTLMAIIASAADGTARMGCLHDAEELLLADYALAPLYTHGVVWEVRPELTGVLRDARGWFSFADVLKIPETV